MSSSPAQPFEGSLAVPSSPPTYTLYDAKAVALATFFGSTLAGGLLMALNETRLGEKGKAAGTATLAFFGTALLIGIEWMLPQALTLPIAIGLVFAMKAIAQSTQGMELDEHLRQGGQLASRWKAFWISLATLAVMLAIVVAVISLKDYRPRVTIGSNDSVYYSGSATRADAQSLGSALKTSGYFTDHGSDVILDKGTTGATVSFIVKDGAWNDPAFVQDFEIVGEQVAPSIGGYPIQVRMLNGSRDVEETSTVGLLVLNGKDHIYYLGDATGSEAQSLGDALKDSGYFSGAGDDVLLSKHDDGVTLSFVVSDGVWDKPDLVSGFEKLARQVAPSIGASPLKLRLVSTTLQLKKEESL